MIICGVCRRCVEGAEIALDFGANARGRLYLTGLCRRCFHTVEQAGASLFAPDAPDPVPVKTYDGTLD